ncbi:hypothetical protein CYMTET_18090 [Cymbomonas tetramitiformis]|uniref:EF-hand domain-containing protein n=1 Tax=Cymbomonas tetramitiformis TaxID=36881 RepID=A0AAE0L6M3_9CHLO|nr:hypothetical protein CYMTET_18090 [Cymbomonas tetramitiformis]
MEDYRMESGSPDLPEGVPGVKAADTAPGEGFVVSNDSVEAPSVNELLKAKIAYGSEDLRYKTLAEFDKDHNGLLSEEELSNLRSVQGITERLELLGFIKSRVAEILDRKAHYRDLFSYLAFCMFYFALLFLQRKAYIAYDVTFTLTETVAPQENFFTSSDELYDWLTDLVSEVWQDPRCGDKLCEAPYEYAGFGPEDFFGCAADCGVNKDTMRVNVSVHASSMDHLDSAEVGDFLQYTQWNLCTTWEGLKTGAYDLESISTDLFQLDENDMMTLANPPSTGRTGVMCWWNEWNKFSTVPETWTAEINLLIGEWKMLVYAPLGSIGMIIVNASNDGKEEIARMPFCQPRCNAEAPCGEGEYCTYELDDGQDGLCSTCPEPSLCKYEVSYDGSEAATQRKSDACSHFCGGGAEDAGAFGSMPHFINRTWSTLSLHQVCLTDAEPSAFMESPESCKIGCEDTEECIRVNVEADSAGTFQCTYLKEAQCGGMREEQNSTYDAAFEIVRTELSQEIIEAGYTKAYPAESCEESRRVLVSILPRELNARALSLQLTPLPEAAEESANGARSERVTESGAPCLLPYTLDGTQHSDCVWRRDDTEPLSTSVSEQARWMCPTTEAAQLYSQSSDFAWAALGGNACRGDDALDNSETYYDLFPATTRAECEELCRSYAGACYGIETNADLRCEIWTRPIQATKALDGYRCYEYIGYGAASDGYSGVPLECYVAPEKVPEDFAQCVMQGHGMHVEGNDMAHSTIHVFEMCGIDPKMPYRASVHSKDYTGLYNHLCVHADHNKWECLDDAATQDSSSGPSCNKTFTFSLETLKSNPVGNTINEVREFMDSLGYIGYLSQLATAPVTGSCPAGTMRIRTITHIDHMSSKTISWWIKDPVGELTNSWTKMAGPFGYVDALYCLNTSAGTFDMEYSMAIGCEDNATFVDEQGYSCSGWRGEDCSGDWGYSELGAEQLIVNCPVSCGYCEDPSGAIQAVNAHGCNLGQIDISPPLQLETTGRVWLGGDGGASDGHASFSGYRAVGAGICQTRKYHAPRVEADLYGQYMHLVEGSAEACMAACSSSANCQAVAVQYVDNVVQCSLYNVLQHSAGDEASATCYNKIYDGTETCEGTVHQLFDAEAVVEGWAGCPETSRIRTRFQASLYAQDASWEVLRVLSVPVITADSNSTGDHHMYTVMGGHSFQDLEERIQDWCMQPGTYVLYYYDDNRGYTRPAVQSDQEAQTYGWFNGTLTLADADDLGLLRLSVSNDGIDQDVYVRAVRFEVAESSGWRLLSEPQVGQAGNFTMPFTGKALAMSKLCQFEHEGPYHIMRLDRLAWTKAQGVAGAVIRDRICRQSSCLEPVAYGVGSFDTGCCYSIKGWQETKVVLNTTGNYQVTHVPVDDSAPRIRYLGVSGGNRMLTGILISQTRYSTVDCTSKYSKLVEQIDCLGFPLSTEPYGVDPVFLTTSELYRTDLAPAKCCNISSYTTDCMPPACGDFYEQSELDYSIGADEEEHSASSGDDAGHQSQAPFGFFPDGEKFYVWFDANLDASRSQQMITYMKDGLYIDSRTKEVKVQIVTYNGQLQRYGNIEMFFRFEYRFGGVIRVKQNIQTLNLEMYESTADMIRFAFEIMFAILVAMALHSELCKVLETRRATGCWKHYFLNGWNLIDMCSLMLTAGLSITWWSLAFSQVMGFDMEVQYFVYTDLQSPGRWLRLKEDGEQFRLVRSEFETMSSIADRMVEYMMLNGVNTFFLLARAIKRFNFQPRMGILTRTIAMATSDLGHFFILLSIVFTGYAITGHLIFGSSLQAFSDMYESLYTLFNMMVFGDNSVVKELDELGKSLGGAMQFISFVFYFSFAILVVMVLVNFLLAIVVDSFVAVKDSVKDSTSIVEDLHYYCRHFYHKLCQERHLTDEQMLKVLTVMHATEVELLSQNALGRNRRLSARFNDQAEGSDAEWEEKILILDSKTPSVTAKHVEKQLRVSADNLEKHPPNQSVACKKRSPFHKLMSSQGAEVVEIKPVVTDECASLVARKIMQKFGQEEHEDDVDEERLFQKNALEELLASVKLLTAQVTELSKRQQAMETNAQLKSEGKQAEAR